jgi:hypothetical protein
MDGRLEITVLTLATLLYVLAAGRIEKLVLAPYTTRLLGFASAAARRMRIYIRSGRVYEPRSSMILITRSGALRLSLVLIANLSKS